MEENNIIKIMQKNTQQKLELFASLNNWRSTNPFIRFTVNRKLCRYFI